MFRVLIRSYLVVSNIKGYVLVALIMAAGMKAVFDRSSDGNISLFALSVTIHFSIAVFVVYKFLRKSMRLSDVAGNIFTFGFILYASLFLLSSVVPEFSMDSVLQEKYDHYLKYQKT